LDKPAAAGFAEEGDSRRFSGVNFQLVIAYATKMESQNSNDVAANKTKMVENSLLKYIHFGAHL